MPKQQSWERSPLLQRVSGAMALMPPTVQAIVFLLVFRTVIAVVTALWGVWWSPLWQPNLRIGFTVFMLLMSAGFTAIIVAIVVRGSIISPYVLTVLGVFGVQYVISLTMVDVVFAAACVLLVVFAWSPSAREHVRRMRESRRNGPRLPYRYDGPQPKKEDFSTGE